MAKNKKTKPSQTVKPSPKQTKSKSEPVPLTEREHLIVGYQPRLIKIVSIFLMVILPFFFILSFLAMYYGSSVTHSNIEFWSGFFLFLAAVLGWPMVMALYRLPKEKFACFGFMKYFLRLKEPYLVIASYSGKCPVCYKKLDLVFNFPGSLLTRDSYFAKCHGKPEHTFPPQKLDLFDQDNGLHS
jgi:hypothetical protein